MFPVADINLPAGSTVRLVPGSVHLAVHGLDDALGDGAEVPVTLRFEDAAGVITERALVLRLSPGPPSMLLPATDRK
jgi:copper(I)-binding protein